MEVKLEGWERLEFRCGMRFHSPKYQPIVNATRPASTFGLDEHFILLHGTPLASSAILGTTTAKEIFKTGCHPMNYAGDLPDRGHHRFLHNVGGILHALEGSAEHLIGADDL